MPRILLVPSKWEHLCSSEEVDRVALFLPLNLYSDSVLLFFSLNSPVPPVRVLILSVGAFDRQMPVCAFVYYCDQAEMKSRCCFCGLAKFSAISVYLYSVIL